MQGYKTRRILKEHPVVKKLRLEYADLISFAFRLQLELKQLDPLNDYAQVKQTKALLVQSVKDLNQKRLQFNDQFYSVFSNGAQWIEQSRQK